MMRLSQSENALLLMAQGYNENNYHSSGSLGLHPPLSQPTLRLTPYAAMLSSISPNAAGTVSGVPSAGKRLFPLTATATTARGASASPKTRRPNTASPLGATGTADIHGGEFCRVPRGVLNEEESFTNRENIGRKSSSNSKSKSTNRPGTASAIAGASVKPGAAGTVAGTGVSVSLGGGLGFGSRPATPLLNPKIRSPKAFKK